MTDRLDSSYSSTIYSVQPGRREVLSSVNSYAPNLITARSESVFNASVCVQDVIQDSQHELTYLNNDLFQTQQDQMQQQNRRLAAYMAKNKDLDEQIKREIHDLKKFEKKRESEKTEIEIELNECSRQRKTIETIREELTKRKISSRSLDAINENLNGDIMNVNDRIRYTEAKIDDVRVNLDRYERAMENDRDVIQRLKPELEEQKRIKALQMASQETKMMSLRNRRTYVSVLKDIKPKKVIKNFSTQLVKLRAEHLNQPDNELAISMKENEELKVQVKKESVMSEQLNKRLEVKESEQEMLRQKNRTSQNEIARLELTWVGWIKKFPKIFFENFSKHFFSTNPFPESTKSTKTTGPRRNIKEMTLLELD